MDYKFHKELKELSDKYPLSVSEKQNLEKLLKEKGQILPILTWDGYVVDGHNRLSIMEDIGMEPTFKEVHFDSLDDAKLFIIKNYIGQRNLSDGQKYELSLDYKKILARKGKEKQKETLGGYKHAPSVLSTIDKTESHNTQKEIAKDLGWSTGKVAMADKVWKEAEPETKEKIKAGETSINKAYEDIKKKRKKQALEEKKKQYQEKVSQKTTESVSIDINSVKDRYRVIYADPAWSYNDKQDTSNLGGANKHYSTMTTTQICELPVKDISKKDAVLFLWVTSPLLEDGLRVIKEWGFKYKSSFIWDKVRHNMGHYNSVRHEFLLIATKGSCVPDNKKLFDSVQSIEKTEKHSQKPKQFLDIIDTIYGYGDRVELFAREAHTKAWDVWGNEV